MVNGKTKPSNNRTVALLLLLGSVIIGFTIGEIVLREWGNYSPGCYFANARKLGERKLLIRKGLIADADGIQRLDEAVAIEIADSIAKRIQQNDYQFRSINDTLDIGYYCAIQDALHLMTDTINNEFGKYYNSIKKIPESNRTDIQNAIIHFVLHPYNKEGFRSIPFLRYKSGKAKVLLLGDSFTWGGAASVRSKSFADILLAKGYAIYNTGITGMDPEQYLAVAKKYIPLLQPDIVVVNLFVGNDIDFFERPVKPFAPVFYPTNLTNLDACPQAIYTKNVEEVYQFFLETNVVPADSGMFYKACSKTVVTTLFLKILMDYGIVDRKDSHVQDYYRRNSHFREGGSVCQRLVSQIKFLTEQNHAKFIYVQIPDMLWGKLIYASEFPGFADTIPRYIPPVKTTDYIHGHFNDLGHEKYADFLAQIIDSIMPTK